MIVEVKHPLITHNLSLMRKTSTGNALFRHLLRDISRLMCMEVFRDLELVKQKIQTPITEFDAPFLNNDPITLVSVLRAGNGMLDGVLDIVRTAQVGHLGMFRDEKTLEPVDYYENLPKNCGYTVILDPMLATGHSAASALEHVKTKNTCSKIKMMALLSAPEGIAFLEKTHPDVDVYTACIDSHLNEHGYIIPGLGDAGDRIYNSI